MADKQPPMIYRYEVDAVWGFDVTCAYGIDNDRAIGRGKD